MVGWCSSGARCPAKPLSPRSSTRSVTGRGHTSSTSSKPAPIGSTPPCASRLAGCGGCGWMHLDVDAQRRAKATIVDEALRRIGGITEPATVLGPAVAAEGYRTTARVVAGPHGAAGFRSERSHDVVAAPACLVLHPVLRELVADDPPRSRCRGDGADVGGDGRDRGPLGPDEGSGAQPPGGGPAGRRRRDPRGRRRAASSAFRSARSSSQARRRPNCSSPPCSVQHRSSPAPE